jgi:AcrR family transcriptional regulator
MPVMGATAASNRRSFRHEERRTALLAAAAQAINSLGAGAINLNEIAARIGLSRNALYYYVADRTELVFECYRQTCEAALADLTEAEAASEDTGERLRRFIDLGLAHDRPVRAVLSDHDMLPDPQRRAILDLRARQIDRLAAIIRAGIAEQRFRPCDAELVAQALVGMLSWTQLSAAWLAHRDAPANRRRAAEAMHALLLQGLAAPGSCLPAFPTLWPRAFNAFDRQAASDAKAEQLIAAASRLFNQRGIAGVSLDEIGATVGASKGAVYHYFPDKAALVESCLERAFGLYDTYMDIAVSHNGNGLAKAMMVHHLNSQAQAGPIAPMLLHPGYDSLSVGARERFFARAQQLWRSSAAFIEAGIADGSCRSCDAMATAEIAAGAFFWLPKWRPIGDTAAGEAIANELADIVAFGIIAP